MKNYSLSIMLFFLCIILLFSINCASLLTEMADDENTVINTYKGQIDYGLTWKAAMENIEKVKGKVVKWDGCGKAYKSLQGNPWTVPVFCEVS